MRERTVLSSRGQMMILAAVRRDLSLEPGDRLTIRWS
jgi:bifunctional DNA-binding transcriptional regulator/antitoxin component of YhaV-PrlF toxin-antitoxin module